MEQLAECLAKETKSQQSRSKYNSTQSRNCHVAGQFTGAPPTCPGGMMIFTCTVTGDRNGVTIWRVDGSSECLLTHNTAGATSNCGPGNTFTARSGTGFGTSATSYSSTLSGPASPTLNGTLVECFGPAFSRDTDNRVGESTIQVLGPPSVSALSSVDLSEDVSGAVNVTVSWTLSGGDSADFYLINITTNAPQTPYGGLLNITTGSATLTGLIAGYEYNITVRGVNCGSQEGRESEPLTITPQGIPIPESPTITTGTPPLVTTPPPTSPLEVYYANNTPHVVGNTVAVQVYTNKPASATCRLGRVATMPCPPGQTTVFQNVPSGWYSLRVIAASNMEKEKVIWKLYVPTTSSTCTVNLINAGLVVDGTSVSTEFRGVGSTAGFTCRLDRGRFSSCTSPLSYSGLTPGQHRIRILAQGCQQTQGQTYRFTV